MLTKSLDIIEEPSGIRIGGIAAKRLEEVKAASAFVNLIPHEMRAISFCQNDVSTGSNEEAPVQQGFDLCPCTFVLFHVVPMFVCGSPGWLVAVPRLDEVGDERADLQEVMENWLNVFDEADSPVSRWEMKDRLRVEVCWENLTNVEKARSHGILNRVGWGVKHLCKF